ncbi:MAG TPA: hypothetical protein VKZ51_05265 [Cyclobacteriaceae bacterium]|nr:hypothetical protein [Cyclobacteriaceae bacterium]
MSWMLKDESKLLRNAFLVGLFGILVCLISLFNRNMHFFDYAHGAWLTGIGIGAQLFSLSITVLLLRKRGIDPEIKGRTQRMTVALTVALLFFFII